MQNTSHVKIWLGILCCSSANCRLGCWRASGTQVQSVATGDAGYLKTVCILFVFNHTTSNRLSNTLIYPASLVFFVSFSCLYYYIKPITILGSWSVWYLGYSFYSSINSILMKSIENSIFNFVFSLPGLIKWYEDSSYKLQIYLVNGKKL